MKILVSIVRWLLGLFFLLGGLVEFSSAPFAGLTGFLIAALLIPPVSKAVFSKIGPATSGGVKGLLAGLLIVIFFSNIPADQNAAQTTELAPSTPIPETPAPEAQRQFYSVTSVTDGDTLKVMISGTEETVRLVGVNTPETVDPRKSVECFGVEASNRLKQMATGKNVYLKTDVQQSDRDQYDRLLRFVFLEDGTDIGLTMIKEGYAQEALYSTTPHIYREAYVAAQAEARENKLGLWADNVCVTGSVATPRPTVTTTPRPTAAATTKPAPTVQSTNYSCSGPDLDCSNFSTHAEAQAFFDACGFTATNDPMRLDSTGVGDGVACESLP